MYDQTMVRKSPTMAEKLAATLLELQRLRGDPIDREDAKAMTAAQICSLFHFDHAAGYACDGADNHPTVLTPLLIAVHRKKTATIDVPAIAKGKRLHAEHEAFKARVLARVQNVAQPDRDKKMSRKIQSRGFQKKPQANSHIRDLVRTDGAICSSCAHDNGAKWPKGHQATHWNGICDACGRLTACCAVSDWHWPLIQTEKAGREF